MAEIVNPQPCLSVRGLRINLPAGADRAHAVNGISFDVGPGEVVCLLGESGSGKSVIAQAVMGLLPAALVPSGGVIELQGENLLNATPARLRAPRRPLGAPAPADLRSLRQRPLRPS